MGVPHLNMMYKEKSEAHPAWHKTKGQRQCLKNPDGIVAEHSYSRTVSSNIDCLFVKGYVSLAKHLIQSVIQH